MIDEQRLVPLEEMRGEDEADTALLGEAAAEARRYVDSLPHWSAIHRLRFGWGVGGIVAVFLVDAVPAHAGVDEQIWVIVGDVPPLYLVTDEIPDALGAIATYIDHREAWVRAVRADAPLGDIAPVNVPATPEWADELSSRLAFLRTVLAEQGGAGPARI